MGYAAIDVHELPAEGPTGVVRKARKALGARAFGFNHFTLPADAEGREHDHAAGGQEEVYVVLAGSGTMRVGGDEVELRPGVLVRVDAETTRQAVAGPDGLEFITFGRSPDGPYEPPAWE